MKKLLPLTMLRPRETVADGEKRAKIKEAEGYKQSKILHAEGEAEAIKLVNEAADKYFTGGMPSCCENWRQWNLL